MPDEQNMAPTLYMFASFQMDFCYQWTGRVNSHHIQLVCAFMHRTGNPMCRENNMPASWHFIQLFYKNSAFLGQIIDHPLIMHNLVPNIDRRAKLIYGAFYNLDGAFNASAKPARRGQNQCFRTRYSSLSVQASAK